MSEAAADGNRIVVSHVRAKPGMADEVEALIAPHAAETHTEAGVQVFAMHRDTRDPEHFVFVEIYDGQADLEAHRLTPHYKRTMARLPDLIEGAPDSTPLDRIPLGDPIKGIVN
jgi:quinol monooxygenase YgiN